MPLPVCSSRGNVNTSLQNPHCQLIDNEDRKYYIGKTCVAWNRNIREGQDKKKPSLVEFRKNNLGVQIIAKHGTQVKRKENKHMLFRPGDMIEIKPPLKKDVCLKNTLMFVEVGHRRTVLLLDSE